MNRRRALFTITAVGTGAVASIGGWRLYSIYKTPDIDFLIKHDGLIHDLSGVIIPTSDTPGAKDVLAYKVIIHLVKSADRPTQNNFIDGLKEVKQYAVLKFKKSFHELSDKEKYEVVKYFSSTDKYYSTFFLKVRNKLMGKSFFHILKEYTTIAFCTSEKGATEALAFDYIPGEYNGCVPLTKGQHSWATK